LSFISKRQTFISKRQLKRSIHHRANGMCSLTLVGYNPTFFEKEESMEKMSISLTSDQAKLIGQAVESGGYASSSEVVREALREWKARRLLGSLWDDGIVSGDSESSETIDDIKAEARRQATL